MSAAYILERTLPSGETKRQGPFPSRRAAVIGCAWCITDNGLADHPEAAQVADSLALSDDGSAVTVGGYTFRLVRQS